MQFSNRMHKEVKNDHRSKFSNLHVGRGFIKFLCSRSVGFYSRVFLVFLMKESKERRRKQPRKLMKSHSQPVNLPGAGA